MQARGHTIPVKSLLQCAADPLLQLVFQNKIDMPRLVDIGGVFQKRGQENNGTLGQQVVDLFCQSDPVGTLNPDVQQNHPGTVIPQADGVQKGVRRFKELDHGIPYSAVAENDISGPQTVYPFIVADGVGIIPLQLLSGSGLQKIALLYRSSKASVVCSGKFLENVKTNFI